MIIYKATNKINNMIYIGQTKFDLEKRIKSHKDKSRISIAYFPNAIRKYGVENFEWKIIRYCKTKEELNKQEKYYIKIYNTKIPNGYNLGSGGEGGDYWLGRKHTKEAKQKMSSKMMGNKNGKFRKNYTVSEEIRKKIKEKLLGRKLPMITRIKMSQSRKGISTGPKSLEVKLRQCKKYLFINPKGKKITCEIGFKNFCKKYQLSISSMWRILKNEKDNWNRWKVKSMDEF